jgi:hypothetical protein
MPRGSLDVDRAAGVFGLLATGFAVLLGFVVFLAFTSASLIFLFMLFFADSGERAVGQALPVGI